MDNHILPNSLLTDALPFDPYAFPLDDSAVTLETEEDTATLRNRLTPVSRGVETVSSPQSVMQHFKKKSKFGFSSQSRQSFPYVLNPESVSSFNAEHGLVPNLINQPENNLARVGRDLSKSALHQNALQQFSLVNHSMPNYAFPEKNISKPLLSKTKKKKKEQLVGGNMVENKSKKKIKDVLVSSADIISPSSLIEKQKLWNPSESLSPTENVMPLATSSASFPVPLSESSACKLPTSSPATTSSFVTSSVTAHFLTNSSRSLPEDGSRSLDSSDSMKSRPSSTSSIQSGSSYPERKCKDASDSIPLSKVMEIIEREKARGLPSPCKRRRTAKPQHIQEAEEEAKKFVTTAAVKGSLLSKQLMLDVSSQKTKKEPDVATDCLFCKNESSLPCKQCGSKSESKPSTPSTHDLNSFSHISPPQDKVLQVQKVVHQGGTNAFSSSVQNTQHLSVTTNNRCQDPQFSLITDSKKLNGLAKVINRFMKASPSTNELQNALSNNPDNAFTSTDCVPSKALLPSLFTSSVRPNSQYCDAQQSTETSLSDMQRFSSQADNILFNPACQSEKYAYEKHPLLISTEDISLYKSLSAADEHMPSMHTALSAAGVNVSLQRSISLIPGHQQPLPKSENTSSQHNSSPSTNNNFSEQIKSLPVTEKQPSVHERILPAADDCVSYLKKCAVSAESNESNAKNLSLSDHMFTMQKTQSSLDTKRMSKTIYSQSSDVLNALTVSSGSSLHSPCLSTKNFLPLQHKIVLPLTQSEISHHQRTSSEIQPSQNQMSEHQRNLSSSEIQTSLSQNQMFDHHRTLSTAEIQVSSSLNQMSSLQPDLSAEIQTFLQASHSSEDHCLFNIQGSPLVTETHFNNRISSPDNNLPPLSRSSSVSQHNSSNMSKSSPEVKYHTSGQQRPHCESENSVFTHNTLSITDYLPNSQNLSSLTESHLSNLMESIQTSCAAAFPLLPSWLSANVSHTGPGSKPDINVNSSVSNKGLVPTLNEIESGWAQCDGVLETDLTVPRKPLYLSSPLTEMSNVTTQADCKTSHTTFKGSQTDSAESLPPFGAFAGLKCENVHNFSSEQVSYTNQIKHQKVSSDKIKLTRKPKKTTIKSPKLLTHGTSFKTEDLKMNLQNGIGFKLDSLHKFTTDIKQESLGKRDRIVTEPNVLVTGSMPHSYVQPCSASEPTMDPILTNLTPEEELADRLRYNKVETVPHCDCLGPNYVFNESIEGPYYSQLGTAKDMTSLREIMEKRTGLVGNAIRIEKIHYTGKEGRSAQGCPIAKWIIRRSGPQEKYLCVTRKRPGHFCSSAFIIVAIVAWEGVSHQEADTLYSFLVSTLTKHGFETDRRCGTNDQKTCACQGIDLLRRGASFSFGCSWSMYFNGCKFARSHTARKFKLKDTQKEKEIESHLQDLATNVAPLYKTLVPDAYRNQTHFEEQAKMCRLGNKKGRPFSGVTACVDFCAHAHKDFHNMQNGSTVVVTLTKNRGLSKPDDEQLHVLPLYILDNTDEYGSVDNQMEKVRSGALEILHKYPLQARLRANPLSTKKRSRTAKKESPAKGDSSVNVAEKSPTLGMHSPNSTARDGIFLHSEDSSHSLPDSTHSGNSNSSMQNQEKGIDQLHLTSMDKDSLLASENSFSQSFAPVQMYEKVWEYFYANGTFPPNSFMDKWAAAQKHAMMNSKHSPGGDMSNEDVIDIHQSSHYQAANSSRQHLLFSSDSNQISESHELKSNTLNNPANLTLSGTQECNGSLHNSSVMKNNIIGRSMSEESEETSNCFSHSSGMSENCISNVQLTSPQEVHLDASYVQAESGNMTHLTSSSQFASPTVDSQSWSPLCPPSLPLSRDAGLNTLPDKSLISHSGILHVHDAFTQPGGPLLSSKFGCDGTKSPLCNDPPASLFNKDASQSNGTFITPTLGQGPGEPTFTMIDPTVVKCEWQDNVENFHDPGIGGVAIALNHGAVLFEVAKRELHATTGLKKPNRYQPTRISLVFYQHKNLNAFHHGYYEYERKLAAQRQMRIDKLMESGATAAEAELAVKPSRKRKKKEEKGEEEVVDFAKTSAAQYKYMWDTTVKHSSTLTTDSIITRWIDPQPMVTGPYQRWV